MLNPLRFLEQIFYKLRDFLWNYPDYIFGDSRTKRDVKRYYKSFIPFSHFLLSVLTFIMLTTLLFGFSRGIVTNARDKILIEGVVMGVNENGDILEINKINPLLPSNIQLEKDLVDLIYEPLIKYEYVTGADGNVEPQVVKVLADSVVPIKVWADYQFNLKKGVKWHDGKEFTADDVVRTLEVMSEIDAQNAYVQAIKQLQWEKLDKYSIRICTKPANADSTLKCNERDDNPIIPNFLELMAVKIIPNHKSYDISPSNVNSSKPNLYRSPVGTGKFIFKSITGDNIYLERNINYHVISEVPKIDQIRFHLYKDFVSATEGLQNGEVHSLVSISTEFVDNMSKYKQINKYESPVLYNQFWGMYFNLRKNPSGDPIGPKFFSDVKVRKAIALSINKEDIVNNILKSTAEATFGPIPKISYYFNDKVDWYSFDAAKARKLLDDAGWKLEGDNKYRTDKDGNKLSFSLYFVNNFDRKLVAEQIRDDLLDVGIEVIIDKSKQQNANASGTDEGWSLQDLNEQIVAPRLFDAVIYGMDTFIDPDRYELYHSSQTTHPGLNIAGYTGSVETVRPKKDRKEGESSLERLPKIDRILDQRGRTRTNALEDTSTIDPEEEKKIRKENYDEFQSLLAEDAPLVFLYHPKFLYYVNNDIKNVDMTDVSSIENRFRNISEWDI